MRISALLIAGCIAFPAVAADHKPPRILIVVDTSASMATSWPGQAGDRLGGVRTTLDALGEVFQRRKIQPEIALRVFGDQWSPNDDEASTGSSLVRPWTPADQGDLGSSLDSIQPRGSSSLGPALAAAASDLESPNENDLVLIILDGLDGCREDLQKGFGALTLEGLGAEVHVFGFGLGVTDQAVLSTHSKFHVIGLPAQLLQGVSTVLSRRLSLPMLPEPIGLALNGVDRLGFDLKSLDIFGTWSKEPITVDLSREKLRIKVSLGTATVVASGSEEGQTQRLVRLPVVPERTLQLEFAEPEAIHLSIEPQESGWGRAPALLAIWTDAPEEEFQLVLQERGVPGASWFHAQTVVGPTGHLTLPLPAKPMEMTLQLRRPIGAGEVVVAEIHFGTPGRIVTLDAPETAEAGTSVGVSWDAESYPGDVVTLVAADAAPETFGSLFDAVEGSPCDFFVPFDQCSYEIRYVDGRSFEVLARARLEVYAPAAGLLAPPTVAGSEAIAVRWWGPADPLDVITLTEKDAEGSEYLDWASPADGSPARLRAPRTPGDHEIRYIAADTTIAATLPLTVAEIGVTLDVPETVRAGGRLRVAWSGPNNTNDFLVLVRPGEDVKRHLDFAYVSTGSPITMASPNRPGLYEVRYIATQPRRILASVTVEVVK